MNSQDAAIMQMLHYAREIRKFAYRAAPFDPAQAFADLFIKTFNPSFVENSKFPFPATENESQFLTNMQNHSPPIPEPLYLYLISAQTIGYDTYDSAVVVARNEKEAQRIHPSGEWQKGLRAHGWITWRDLEIKVKVQLLGKVDYKVESGTVVLASFNAG